MTGFPRRIRSDHGAVFIHVAIGMLVLLGFTALVVDYGMLMVARNQAQNSADAGALAGAASLAFDGALPGDRWDRARNVAWNVGVRNVVWADTPGVAPDSPYDAIPICEPNEGKGCIRVDVFRDGSNGSNPLETWFARLFGVTTQSTRAMAVAQTAPASGTNCLKPWLVPDRWGENTNPPNEYNTGDVYTRPTLNEDGSMNYGTGWTPNDIGETLVLKPGNPSGAISPSDFFEVEDATLYEESIYGCELTKSIGDTVTALPGSRMGPTVHGVEELLLRSGGNPTVIIGMFDPAQFAAQDRNSGTFPLEIVNMLAFRINDIQPNGTITGTIVGAPAEMATVCSSFPCPTSTGLVNIIRLVR